MKKIKTLFTIWILGISLSLPILAQNSDSLSNSSAMTTSTTTTTSDNADQNGNNRYIWIGAVVLVGLAIAGIGVYLMRRKNNGPNGYEEADSADSINNPASGI